MLCSRSADEACYLTVLPPTAPLQVSPAHWSSHVAPKPAAMAAHGTLREMQIPVLQSRPINSEPLGLEPSNFGL